MPHERMIAELFSKLRFQWIVLPLAGQTITDMEKHMARSLPPTAALLSKSSAEHLYHGPSECQRHQLGLADKQLFHLCSAARLPIAHVAV
jgi:hypothetical protein